MAIVAQEGRDDILDILLRAALLPLVNAMAVPGQFPVVLPDGTFGFASGTGNGAAFRSDAASTAPGKGAALIALEGGGSVQARIATFEVSTLYSSQFASLPDALGAWRQQGGELIIDADYSIPTPGAGTAALSVQLLADKEYMLSTRTKRKLTYAGSHIQTLLHIVGANNAPLTVSGITFDGDGKTNKPLFIDYSAVTGAGRPNVDVSGTFLNAYGATAGMGDIAGLKVVGGMDMVHIHDFIIDGIDRAAGVGTPGYNGSQGLQLFGTAGASYRSAVIERGRVSNLTTADDINGTHYVDMDGILAFQEIEAGARAPVIRDVTVSNAPGRAIKMYAPNPGALAENIIINRSTHGIGKGMVGGPGFTIDIDFQQGDGIVRNVAINYSGDAHYTKTIPIQIIQVNARAASNPLGPTIIEGMRISDTTLTGIKGCVASVLDSTGPANEKRSIRITNVSDSGKAEELIRTNKLGSHVRVDIELSQIDVDVSVAATRTSDTTPYLFVKGRNIVNRNGTVRPVKVNLANGMSTLDWGDWEGDETIHGFARYTGGWRGNPTFTNGFRGPGGGVEAAPPYGKSEASGRVVPPVVTLADGATWTGPPVGQYQAVGGDYVFAIRLLGTYLNDHGRWRTGATTTGFTALDAIAGAVIEKTDTGADTGSTGKVVVWKDGPTQLQKVTNHTGAPLRFQPVYNP